MIFFTFLFFFFIQEIQATIPFHLFHGEWAIQGIYMERGNPNKTEIETHIIKTSLHKNKVDIYNVNSDSRYYLYAINATSFLFENNGTTHDSPFLEYPFLFTLFKYNNLLFSSFRARGETWVDIIVTNNFNSIAINTYSPAHSIVLIANKKVEDTRSVFHKYYFIYILISYVIFIAFPYGLWYSWKRYTRKKIRPTRNSKKSSSHMNKSSVSSTTSSTSSTHQSIPETVRKRNEN